LLFQDFALTTEGAAYVSEKDEAVAVWVGGPWVEQDDQQKKRKKRARKRRRTPDDDIYAVHEDDG